MSKLTIPGKIKKGDVIGRKPEKNMGNAEVVEPPRLKDKALRADPADRRDFGDPDTSISVDSLKKGGVAAALLTHSSDLNRGEGVQLARHRAMDEIDKRDKQGVHAEAPKASAGKTDKEQPAPKAASGKSDRKDYYAKDAETPKAAAGKGDRQDSGGKPQLDENGKPKSKIRISFEKAFAQARKDGLKEFEFMGKKYNTRRADGK